MWGNFTESLFPSILSARSVLRTDLDISKRVREEYYS